MICCRECDIFLCNGLFYGKEVGRDIVKRVRVNRQIRAREVRLIGEAGEQLGVLSLERALQIADERNFDLVEVAPTSVPPVCRLLDYGKYRYEQTRKELWFMLENWDRYSTPDMSTSDTLDISIKTAPTSFCSRMRNISWSDVTENMSIVPTS